MRCFFFLILLAPINRCFSLFTILRPYSRESFSYSMIFVKGQLNKNVKEPRIFANHTRLSLTAGGLFSGMIPLRPGSNPLTFECRYLENENKKSYREDLVVIFEAKAEASGMVSPVEPSTFTIQDEGSPLQGISLEFPANSVNNNIFIRINYHKYACEDLADNLKCIGPAVTIEPYFSLFKKNVRLVLKINKDLHPVISAKKVKIMAHTGSGWKSLPFLHIQDNKIMLDLKNLNFFALAPTLQQP